MKIDSFFFLLPSVFWLIFSLLSWRHSQTDSTWVVTILYPLSFLSEDRTSQHFIGSPPYLTGDTWGRLGERCDVVSPEKFYVGTGPGIKTFESHRRVTRFSFCFVPRVGGEVERRDTWIVDVTRNDQTPNDPERKHTKGGRPHE